MKRLLIIIAIPVILMVCGCSSTSKSEQKGLVLTRVDYYSSGINGDYAYDGTETIEYQIIGGVPRVVMIDYDHGAEVFKYSYQCSSEGKLQSVTCTEIDEGHVHTETAYCNLDGIIVSSYTQSNGGATTDYSYDNNTHLDAIRYRKWDRQLVFLWKEGNIVRKNDGNNDIFFEYSSHPASIPGYNPLMSRIEDDYFLGVGLLGELPKNDIVKAFDKDDSYYCYTFSYKYDGELASEVLIEREKKVSKLILTYSKVE